MRDFLAVTAIFISCASAYLVFDLFYTGYSWEVLFFAIIGFLTVHLIWPKKRNSESAWYDSLEFIFDFPYRATAAAVRALGISGDNASVDL